MIVVLLVAQMVLGIAAIAVVRGVRWPKPKHYRHEGWITGDVYCGPCGRGSEWPCPLASTRDRILSALPLDWERHT